jgi:hypothetical protein
MDDASMCYVSQLREVGWPGQHSRGVTEQRFVIDIWDAREEIYRLYGNFPHQTQSYEVQESHDCAVFVKA